MAGSAEYAGYMGARQGRTGDSEAGSREKRNRSVQGAETGRTLRGRGAVAEKGEGGEFRSERSADRPGRSGSIYPGLSRCQWPMGIFGALTDAGAASGMVVLRIPDSQGRIRDGICDGKCGKRTIRKYRDG